MKTVELIGVPGAGKTTIVQSIVQLTSNTMVVDQEDALLRFSLSRMRIPSLLSTFIPWFVEKRLATRLCRYWMVQREALCQFCTKYPRAVSAVFGSNVLADMDETERKWMIDNLQRVWTAWEAIGAFKPNAMALLHEGLVQKSLTFLSATAADERGTLTYLNEIPMPDALIYIRPPLDICMHRIRSRPKGLTKRMQKMSSGQVGDFLLRCQQHLDMAVGWIKENREIDVVTVVNDGDQADAVVHLKSLCCNHM